MKYKNMIMVSPEPLKLSYTSFSDILPVISMNTLTLHYTLLAHYLRLYTILMREELPSESFNYKFLRMYSLDYEFDLFGYSRVGILNELVECSASKRKQVKVMLIVVIIFIMAYVVLLIPFIIYQNHEVNIMLEMIGNLPTKAINIRLKYIAKFSDILVNAQIIKDNKKILKDVSRKFK